MAGMAFNALYAFFIFLELMIYLYIFASWIPISKHFKEKLDEFMDPLLEPIRYLLKKSIFNTPRIDLSPVIGLAILSYLQELFLQLK